MPETSGPTAETEQAGRALPGGERHIGPYKLLRELGRGGMGVVYLAARDDAEYRRRVAIKVVPKGADTEQVLRHFRRERQILAALDHPNIARLLDGGTTDEGQPYIVMEYVEGEPIDRYCDRHLLPVRERIGHVLAVCAAVAHAHRSLVVHRDLKPANILVTADGTPKLLDFGIAKLLNPELAGDAATATRMALTPAYASPEQIRGEPVTTGTDVYSLGVVLYELLTGHRPYRLTDSGTAALYKAILEEEPERPSSVIGRTAPGFDDASSRRREATPEGVARSREGTTDRLRRRLRGDLDNILLRALRKESNHRYPSVEALAEDLRRHLDGRPVAARRRTLVYRLGKFLRRNWPLASAGATLAAVVVSFAVVTAVQARRLRVERDRSDRVTTLLVDLFTVADPSEVRGNTVTAREVLDKGADTIARELKEEPELRSNLMVAMAEAYSGLGLFGREVALREEVLRIRRQALGAAYGSEAEDLNSLGAALRRRGELAEAEGRIKEALAVGRRRLGAGHPAVARSLSLLASAVGAQGRSSEAESLYREALALRRRAHGQRSGEAAETLAGLGRVLIEQGRYGDAADALREALSIRRQRFGDSDARTITAFSNLSAVLYYQGRYEEAEAVSRDAVSAKRALAGQRHPELAPMLVNLGSTLGRLEKWTDAEAAFREAVDIGRLVPGGPDPDLGAYVCNLAGALCRQEKYAEAEPLYREAVRLQRSAAGAGRSDLPYTLSSFSWCRQRSGSLVEAERLSREAVSIAREALPREHPDHPYFESVLGGALVGLGRFSEAEPLLSRSLQALAAQPGKAREARETLRSMLRMYTEWKRPLDAASVRARLEAEEAVAVAR